MGVKQYEFSILVLETYARVFEFRAAGSEAWINCRKVGSPQGNATVGTLEKKGIDMPIEEFQDNFSINLYFARIAHSSFVTQKNPTTIPLHKRAGAAFRIITKGRL